MDYKSLKPNDIEMEPNNRWEIVNNELTEDKRC